MSTEPTTDGIDVAGRDASDDPPGHVVGAAGAVPLREDDRRHDTTAWLMTDRLVLSVRVERLERTLADRDRAVRIVRDRYERVLEARAAEGRETDERDDRGRATGGLLSRLVASAIGIVRGA